MALRGGRCLLARRFADRGNDRSMFVSRARGEDQHHVRRYADRGSDRVDSDPRDLKIWRPKQRVQDLEGSSTWKETEPEGFVWDELTGDEEHPIHGDIIYDSPPVYDEYMDEEWYSWFSGNFTGSMKEGAMIIGGVGPTSVDAMLDMVANGGDETSLKTHKIMSANMKGTKSELSEKWYPKFFEFQNKDFTVGVEHMEQVSFNLKSQNSDEVESTYSNGDLLSSQIQKEIIEVISMESQAKIIRNFNSLNLVDDGFGINYGLKKVGAKVNRKYSFELDMMEEGLLNLTYVPIINNNFYNLKFEMTMVVVESQNMDKDDGVFCHVSMKFSGRPKGRNAIKIVERYANFGELNLQVKTLNLKKPIIHSILYSGRANQHGQLRYVLRSQDIPFDPGGFGPEAKLEDEFFSKRGRMMQSYLQVQILKYYLLFLFEFPCLSFYCLV